MEHSLWVEKYRPNTLTTYVGNEHLKEKVKRYIDSEDVPHLLLYGKAGTGKTTLAKIVVNNLSSDAYFADTIIGLLWEMFKHRLEHLRRDGVWTD